MVCDASFQSTQRIQNVDFNHLDPTVFICGPKQNAGSLLKPVFIQFSMLFHMEACIFSFSSMVTSIATDFKDSDWSLKSVNQHQSAWKSYYHGQQNQDHHVKE